MRWVPGIFSCATSMPKSPRATILRKLLPGRFVDVINTFLVFYFGNNLNLHCCAHQESPEYQEHPVCYEQRVSNKIYILSIANRMLFLSFQSAKASLYEPPGTFTLLRLPSVTSFCTSHKSSQSVLSITFKARSPSSIRTSPPTRTSFYKTRIETEMQSRVVSLIRISYHFHFVAD